MLEAAALRPQLLFLSSLRRRRALASHAASVLRLSDLAQEGGHFEVHGSLASVNHACSEVLAIGVPAATAAGV